MSWRLRNQLRRNEAIPAHCVTRPRQAITTGMPAEVAISAHSTLLLIPPEPMCERDIPIWTLDRDLRMVQGTMASVFPTGGYANPTLTLVALAIVNQPRPVAILVRAALRPTSFPYTQQSLVTIEELTPGLINSTSGMARNALMARL